LVPVAIWCLVYRSQWRVAFRQMSLIANHGAPGPSVLRFGYGLLKKSIMGQHDLMLFVFFSLCLAVVLLVTDRAIVALRSGPVFRITEPAARSYSIVHVTFAIATPITIALLLWVIPASITRYEVLYPIYLIALAFPVSGQLPRPGLVRGLRLMAVAAICAEAAAGVVYSIEGALGGGNSAAATYAAVVECIPRDASIAASPQLWLAFEERNRPFTLLYRDFDGLRNWLAKSEAPLGRFDVILLDDELKDDLAIYLPYSEPGRYEKEYRMGSQTLRVYSKRPVPDEPCTHDP
jgi:hypothetical protein